MVKTTPQGQQFIRVGIYAASAGAIYGLISLSYYGLGFSNEPSAWRNIRNRTWQDPVRLNIQKTYIYLIFSLYICVITAFFVFSHPPLLKMFSSIAFVLLDVIIEAVVDKGKVFTNLSSSGFLSIQKIAWASYCAFIGALSSSYLINGVKIIQFSLRISFTVIGALAILSINAPIKKYYNWLHFFDSVSDIIGFASVGAVIVPVKYTLGAFFFSLSLYGGLLIYPLNFLSHAQEAHLMASRARPPSSYCAPAMSIPLLLSTMSFFSRMVLLYISTLS